jgi:predicted phosphodiesterase
MITPVGLNFGEQFRCDLIIPPKPVCPVSIPVTSNPMRLLLVSDSHIGAALDPSQSIPQFLRALEQIARREQATHIVHLGDLVQGQFLPEIGGVLISEVVKGMNELHIPTWLIGGNHDREFVQVATWPKAPSVTRVTELALVIDVPGPSGQRIFLSHDLGNNYRVRDYFAFSFLSWIKNGFKALIKPTDWLLTGHCHTSFLSAESRLGCVGQFAPEISAYAYTILEVGEGVSVNLKCMLDQQEKSR